MSLACNTGEWFSLRPPLAYRKVRLYPLNGEHANVLESSHLFASSLGGPIARVGKDQPKSRRIEIFTAAGVQLGACELDRLWLALGWSKLEDLVCVFVDGSVMFYDVNGRVKRSILGETKKKRLLDAKVVNTPFGTIVARFTSDGQIQLMRCDVDITPTTLWSPPTLVASIKPPYCWQVIRPEYGEPFCLLAKGCEIIKLTSKQEQHKRVNLSKQMLASFDHILSMCVTFNQKRLAVYTNSGCVWLGTSDLNTKLCEIDAGLGGVIPKQMEWIMNADNNSSDAIILSYPFRLKVFHLSGESMSFTYASDPVIHLVPELDGVRALSSEGHEMIQTIPYCLDNIFGDKSMSDRVMMPSSCLFESHDQYKGKQMKFSKHLEVLKTVDLWSQAVSECIEAAGFVFDSYTQVKLVQAARFGIQLKKELNGADITECLMSKCNFLRLLNTLRCPKIGMPLTYNQFVFLGIDNVLTRLMTRGFVTLAIKIGECFRVHIKCTAIEDWAQALLNDTNTPDVDICGTIASKIITTRTKGICFKEIAHRAAQIQRKSLALMLIDLEPRNNQRFDFLNTLGEYRKAIYVAHESYDMDQMLVAYLDFSEKARPDELLTIFNELPTMRVLYRNYLKTTNPEKYRTYLIDHRYNRELAEFELRHAIENNNLPECLDRTRVAYERDGCVTEAKICKFTEEWLTLKSSFSKQLQLTGDTTLLNMIKNLYLHGLDQQVKHLRKRLGVSDRLLDWQRVQIFAEHSMWDDLQGMSKKSSLGFEPFVEICLLKSNFDELQKYVVKLPKRREVFWLIRARLLSEAADAAFMLEDSTSLNRICILANRAGLQDISKHASSLLCETLDKQKELLS